MTQLPINCVEVSAPFLTYILKIWTILIPLSHEGLSLESHLKFAFPHYNQEIFRHVIMERRAKKSPLDSLPPSVLVEIARCVDLASAMNFALAAKKYHNIFGSENVYRALRFEGTHAQVTGDLLLFNWRMMRQEFEKLDDFSVREFSHFVQYAKTILFIYKRER